MAAPSAFTGCLAPGLLCLWAIRLASGVNVVILFGSVLSSGITFCNKTSVWSSGVLFYLLQLKSPKGFPCGSADKESTCKVGDLGSIPGLGRSPGDGNGNPLGYSGLENLMDCIVHGVAKSQTWLNDLHFTSKSSKPEENFKILPKGLKGDLNKARDLPCSLTGPFNIIKF